MLVDCCFVACVCVLCLCFVVVFVGGATEAYLIHEIEMGTSATTGRRCAKYRQRQLGCDAEGMRNSGGNHAVRQYLDRSF